MTEAEPTEKLKRLEEAADHGERHSLALELFNSRDPRILETVVKVFERCGLQPMMKVEVMTPEDYLGDVIGDLNSRLGRIETTEDRGHAQMVEATVPLANMLGYEDELRSLSENGAHCTMQFSHYDEAPNDGGPPDTEPAAAALRA